MIGHDSIEDWQDSACVPYSLGDAIDWKLCRFVALLIDFLITIPYSLGDAIDWKLFDGGFPWVFAVIANPLLARGRD